MALIPKYHTAVAMFPIDPADLVQINTGSADATYGIFAGHLVGLSSSGYVKKTTANNASTKSIPIGIAGDSFASGAGHSAYTSSLVVNPGGLKKSTQNRVSDYFNETLGSGLMTVYITGGEFYTDMFISGTTATPGATAYAAGVTATTFIDTNSGLLSGASTNAYTVGIFTTSQNGYPSGVPAGDGVDYSMPLSSQTGTGFVSFIMQL